MSISFNNNDYHVNVEIRYFKCPFLNFKNPSPKIPNPSTLDLRGCLTPIRDQGPDGNSAIFAAVALKEFLAIKNCAYNKWLSPWVFNRFLHLLSMIAGRHTLCNYKVTLISVISNIKWGGTPEAIFSEKRSCTDYFDYFNTDVEDIFKYNNIMPNVTSVSLLNSIDDIKTALTNHGPCLIGVDLYNNSSELWKPKGDEKPIGGHALLITGYDNNSFIVRNSWGTAWGNNGYGNLLFSDYKYIITAYTLDIPIDFNNSNLSCNENKKKINTPSIIIFSLIGIFVLFLFIYYIYDEKLYKLPFSNLIFKYGRYTSEIIFYILLIISTMLMYNFNGLNNVFIVNITILVIYIIGILYRYRQVLNYGALNFGRTWH
jgi:hypothetical protein